MLRVSNNEEVENMTRKANGDLIRSLVEKLRELPDGYAVSTWGLLELTGNLLRHCLKRP